MTVPGDLNSLNKQTLAHLISGRQSFVSGRRMQSGRNPTRPFVSDGRTRPGRRVSRPSETGVVSVTDTLTSPPRQTEAWVGVLAKGWCSHIAPVVVMRASLAEITTRYVDVILPQSYGSQKTVQKAKRLLILSKLRVCLLTGS